MAGCWLRRRARAAGTNVVNAVGTLPNRSRPLPAGDLGQLLLGAVQAGADGRAVTDQGSAGVGQFRRARAALDQCQPGVAFQRGDVLADRRLGQAQRLGGGGERAARGDLAQHPDATDVSYQFH